MIRKKVTHIALWGGGAFGKYVLKQLSEMENIIVDYVIDTRGKELIDPLISVPIITPREILSRCGGIEYVLIAITKWKDMYSELICCEGIRVGVLDESIFFGRKQLNSLLTDSRDVFWIEDVRKPLFRQIETNVIDVCNLKCKGCSHFTQLFNEGEAVDFGSFQRDLSMISQKVNVFRLNILGGEPLLNKRINEYLSFSRKVLPYSKICLVTNGLLLPKMSNEFYSVCKNNRIVFDITMYEPTLKIKNAIEKKCFDSGVEYSFREYVSEFGKNIDLSGSANKEEAVKQCRESTCHFFRNGKLYKCPFEALGNRFFEYYGEDVRFNGGYNIFNDINWNEVVDILENKPVDACKYCGREQRFTWETSPYPSKDDWII